MSKEPNVKHKSLKKDLNINKDDLVTELLKIATQFDQWAEEYEKAERDVDNAKLALDTRKAVLDGEMRENPDDFGISKVTDVSIANAITRHPDIKGLSEAHIEGKLKAKLLKQTVEAVRMKDSAITRIIKLYSLGYFLNQNITFDIEDVDQATREHLDELKSRFGERKIDILNGDE